MPGKLKTDSTTSEPVTKFAASGPTKLTMGRIPTFSA